MARQAYAKLQCLDGEDHFVTELPYSIGSGPTSHNIFRCHHLYHSCRRADHCLLSFRDNCFELQAKGNLLVLNSGHYSEDDPPVVVSDLSCVCLPCIQHQQHIFYLVLPTFSIPSLKTPGTAAIPESEEVLDSITGKGSDTAAKNWGLNEKESLKKWLLVYGYGRWSKLQEAMGEGGTFQNKPLNEVRSFAAGFIRTLAEALPLEKTEIKNYLYGLIEEQAEDFFVPPKLKDWGMMIRQRAIAWAKRVQLLYSVRKLIKIFKERAKDGHLKSTQLLNFLPSGAFYGQRPSAWWTRRHDIDLIRGTYQYGYANYFAMRNDKSLSFSQIENDSSFKDFPNADTITRRLKKLMQSVSKCKEFDFDKEQQYFEVTGWGTEDKQALLDLVSDFGVPLNLEGKNDWSQLKEKFDTLRPGSEKNVNNVERMVQHLRMLAQHILHPEEGQPPDLKDADGFSMSVDKAEQLQESMNTIQFIRKHVLKGGSEFFNNELPALEKITLKEKEDSPASDLPWLSPQWKCAEHDRGLLNAVADNGLRFLARISYTESYSFSQLRITEDLAKTRIRALCEFFRNLKQAKSCKVHISQEEKIWGGHTIRRQRSGSACCRTQKGQTVPLYCPA
jgi:hypothetical protein